MRRTRREGRPQGRPEDLKGERQSDSRVGGERIQDRAVTPGRDGGSRQTPGTFRTK